MASGDFYNFDHERITFLEAAQIMGDVDRCRIGLDLINEIEVSTVFLCIDHGHDGVPVLYETLVRGPDGEDLWCERYSTREAALAGHDRACAWVRSPDVAVSPAH